MADVEFRLDRASVREILKGESVRELVDATAAEVAAAVRAQLPGGVEVRVDSYATDRAAASVVIADVRGMAWQARDGILTRAAGSAGLEVKAWQR
ncbi:hypothetical protein [Streptomyces scabiei]|uniref:hypothetical protein n=1 Tax=Streptomyces scabiei TaxID=1930 RepID=UPI0029B29E66|nr:hypothetical protein [Streptomyces scabiei]MDX3027477.1 hypothetical protein [Streptomyces scabiei]